MGILGDDADKAAQVAEGVPRETLAVQADRATGGVPEAAGQPGQGAFARATGTHDGNPAAGAYCKADPIQYFGFTIGKMDLIELENIPGRLGQGSRAVEHLWGNINHVEKPLTSRHRVPKKLKGLRQGLKRFEAGENHQGKKAQVDAIDGFAGNERDGKYENSPQRQVHQDIVQRLLQSRKEPQTPLYLFEFAVQNSDVLLPV